MISLPPTPTLAKDNIRLNDDDICVVLGNTNDTNTKTHYKRGDFTIVRSVCWENTTLQLVLDEREIRLDHTTIQEFKNAGSDHWMDIIASKQEQLVQGYSLPISDVEILRSAHKYFPDNKLFREIPIQVLYVCMCIYVYVCVYV